jgi:hypothetical protein
VLHHNEFTPHRARKEKDLKKRIEGEKRKEGGDSIRHSIHPQKPRGKEKEVVS